MKEQLKEIGLSDEMISKVSNIINKSFIPRGRFNEVNEALKNTKIELDEKTKSFMEIEDEINLNNTLKEKIATLEKEKNDIRFNNAIEVKLLKSGTRNTKALKALINTDEIEFKDNELMGIDEQIEKIKEENGYLFNEDVKSPYSYIPKKYKNSEEKLTLKGVIESKYK